MSRPGRDGLVRGAYPADPRPDDPPARRETVMVGIQPEVAFAMVQLGITLEDIQTSLDLEEGLAFFGRRAPDAGRRDGR